MLPVTMHRKTSLPLCLFFIAPLKWAASDTQTKSAACPQGDITLAGSTTALRQIEAWKEAYQEICPKVDFDFQGGGHAMGAARVCDSHPVYAGVDMAAMPNGFFAPQASTIDGWNYDCHRSERKTIMVSHAKIVQGALNCSFLKNVCDCVHCNVPSFSATCWPLRHPCRHCSRGECGSLHRTHGGSDG